ncbi:hypothetical protein TREES_T100002565 [Tupaia chinensis]|uniref:Uncharacterized protein n=1 Tax=Tupaia chinensis TaxID=246437 RepID=L9L5J7_TUPCH|nr:hypothetical protein TREES_T100002565 [Tupaia chinensis]
MTEQVLQGHTDKPGLQDSQQSAEPERRPADTPDPSQQLTRPSLGEDTLHPRRGCLRRALFTAGVLPPHDCGCAPSSPAGAGPQTAYVCKGAQLGSGRQARAQAFKPTRGSPAVVVAELPLPHGGYRLAAVRTEKGEPRTGHSAQPFPDSGWPRFTALRGVLASPTLKR